MARHKTPHPRDVKLKDKPRPLVECHLRFTDKSLDADTLSVKWKIAMQQEITKTLNASLDIFLAETLASRKDGFKTGAYHLVAARYGAMIDEETDTNENEKEVHKETEDDN